MRTRVRRLVVTGCMGSRSAQNLRRAPCAQQNTRSVAPGECRDEAVHSSIHSLIHRKDHVFNRLRHIPPQVLWIATLVDSPSRATIVT